QARRAAFSHKTVQTERNFPRLFRYGLAGAAKTPGSRAVGEVRNALSASLPAGMVPGGLCVQLHGAIGAWPLVSDAQTQCGKYGALVTGIEPQCGTASVFGAGIEPGAHPGGTGKDRCLGAGAPEYGKLDFTEQLLCLCLPFFVQP